MPASSSGRGLGRAAAGDERQRRADLADDGELLVAQLLGHEAEHADAPRAVAEQLGGLLQQGPHLGLAPQQGEGEERQRRRRRRPPSANAARSVTRVIGPWTTG